MLYFHSPGRKYTKGRLTLSGWNALAVVSVSGTKALHAVEKSDSQANLRVTVDVYGGGKEEYSHPTGTQDVSWFGLVDRVFSEGFKFTDFKFCFFTAFSNISR
jgi:hypothetical protein